MSRNSQTAFNGTTTVLINRAPSFTGYVPFDESTVSYVSRDLARDDVHRTRREADGFRPPTPYSLTEKTFSDYTGSFTLPPANSFSNGFKYSGHLGQFFPYKLSAEVSLPSSNMVNRCITKALLKVKDQNVHLGATIAESRKSVSMIAERATKLLNAVRAVRRGDMKRAAGILGIGPPSKRGKDAASNWLEIQYGWLPLLSDIHGIYEEARLLTSDRSPRFSTTVSLRESLPSTYSPNLTGNPWTFKSKNKQEGFEVVKVNLVYEVNSQTLNDISRNGLLNPLEIAWELVPFSFVVDWMIPIGDWMSALTADVGLTFKSGSMTRFVKNSRVTELTGSGEMEGYAIAKSTFSRMERTLFGSSPIPLPFVKDPFSVSHGLNALALLRSAFK